MNINITTKCIPTYDGIRNCWHHGMDEYGVSGFCRSIKNVSFKQESATPEVALTQEPESELEQYRSWLHTAEKWKRIMGNRTFDKLTEAFHDEQQRLKREASRSKLSDFPDGLLGTQWQYFGFGDIGTVVKHEMGLVDLDFDTSTSSISEEWLLEAYDHIPQAPAGAGEEGPPPVCPSCGMLSCHPGCKG